MKRAALAWTMVAFCACVGNAPRRTAADLDVTEDTTIGGGDVFSVRVYGEEDLSADYRVSQDGSIDFPLIGRLQVAGLEPTQVADLLQTRLREGRILAAPQVSIVVSEYNSKRVSVLGAVRTPGSFPMRSGLRVVEAISLAGGFTALANRDATIVTRRVGNEVRRFRVSVDQITGGHEPDVPLRAGDIVHIPERTI